MTNSNKFENLVSKWVMDEELFLNQVVHDGMRIRRLIGEKIRIENTMRINTLNGSTNDRLAVVLWAVCKVHSPDINRIIFFQ